MNAQRGHPHHNVERRATAAPQAALVQGPQGMASASPDLRECKEDQLNEIEALKSIYAEDFHEITAQPPVFDVRARRTSLAATGAGR
jgi:hypothetical protein